MSLTTCMLHAVQRTDRSVYLTSELVKALRLTGTKSITVKVGSKTATLPIRLIKKVASICTFRFL